MKAAFTTLDDGTVTLVIEAEDSLESQLLTVFRAQTYHMRKEIAALDFGRWKVQFMARSSLKVES